MSSFDELVELAERGDHRSVDMLVKDIYGGAYTSIGLLGDIIASSFGKAARSPKDKNTKSFKKEDLARSLLLSISNDIGQIAYLHARIHNLKKIYFGGYFIRGHPMTMHTITFAINYWSKGMSCGCPDLGSQSLLTVSKTCQDLKISQALTERRLLVIESGQGSPCLDLRLIDQCLVDTIKTMDTDLIIIEGMGRAIHTNFEAAFSCECLKVAVIKNRWLANRFGGEMFNVMFKYERSRRVSASNNTS